MSADYARLLLSMATDSVFAPRYEGSWALVIGINAYTHVSPLGYACNDAAAVASHLRDVLGFPDGNVRLLLDSSATRQTIMDAFLQLVDDVARDDRVLVFFAGHGFTRKARRGEIGYLVPVDGDPAKLSSLIRWDDLTRNAELIPAKHVLFIMDACYGGLALTRTVPAGSRRFLGDMLSRYSRQVLTAGKADEVVADSGGPRPGHSIFTGHLLDALDGAAQAHDGTITANGVMGYVYEHVGKDPYSKQSPHYGFLDGDGDFVFASPHFAELRNDAKQDLDVLVEPSVVDRPVPAVAAREEFANEVKEYLSDRRYRIKLDDLLNRELRALLQASAKENFPTSTPTVDAEKIAERLRGYERAADRFACAMLLIARWGQEDHRGTLERAACRLAENNDRVGGQSVWLGLRWHPADLTLYTAGIAAISAGNYRNLASLFLTKVSLGVSSAPDQTLLEVVVEGVLEATRVDAFKALPGHERHYTPRSDYLYKIVQPLVEDLLYLGRSYEGLFDRFEVLVALLYADLSRTRLGGRPWGPPGRFAWKAARGRGSDPFSVVVAEADQLKDDWPPLKAGLFGGSFARLKEVADQYREIIDRLGWY